MLCHCDIVGWCTTTPIHLWPMVRSVDSSIYRDLAICRCVCNYIFGQCKSRAKLACQGGAKWKELSISLLWPNYLLFDLGIIQLRSVFTRRPRGSESILNISKKMPGIGCSGVICNSDLCNTDVSLVVCLVQTIDG